LLDIVQLLKRSSDIIIEKANDDTDVEYGGITVILLEDDRTVSSPKRVIDMLDSIILVYSAYADISDVSSNDLAVVGCDSGSDKTFDFTGVPQIIDQSKNFFVAIWDRVMFFREKQHSERVKNIAETLPIIEQVSDLVNQGKLSPEMAEIVKRKLVEGAVKFLDTGARLPEFDSMANFPPQQLLKPTPTLLLPAPNEPDKGTAPNQSDGPMGGVSGDPLTGSGPTDRGDIHGLTPEEEAIIRKMRGSGQAN
jgi:hypothetical protein